MSFRTLVTSLEKSFDARSFLARFEPKEHGDNASLECPQCERQDKLWVLLDKKEGKLAGTWICFFCDDVGGPLELVRLLEDCDFFAAIAILQEYSTAPAHAEDLRGSVEAVLASIGDSLEPAPIVPQAAQECPLPKEFVPVKETGPAPTYLAERGISRATAVSRGIGWCKSGFWKNRLIVPVKRRRKVAWFLGRWMRKSPPEGVRKYLNAPGSRSSEDLYGIELLKGCRRAVLVEDVFSQLRHGRGVLATFGTHFSRAQLGLLASFDIEEVAIAWDPDAVEKAWELGRSLSGLWKVRVATLPNGKDPDEMDERSFRKAYLQAPVVGGASAFRGLIEQRLHGFR